VGSFLYEVFIKRIRRFFTDTFTQIREINEKYAVPQIKTNAWTNFALIMLRAYLVVLILLLVYKFITLLK
jgi:hypothetical protein